MTDHDKIIDRIRKLLAMGRGNGNEHEAKIAMERAHKLLAAYNLSLQDVDNAAQRDADPYMRGEVRQPKPSPWRRMVCQAIAKLYFCKYYYSRHYQGGIVHNFVGRTTNVSIATMISDHVCGVLKAEAVRATKANERTTGYRDPGFQASFLNAAAQRVWERCVELMIQAEKGETKDESGNKLPALRSTYLAEQENANKFLSEKLNITLTSGRAGRTVTDHHTAANMGRAAGERVNLRPTVASSSRSAITKK